ncbi:hypothetical protein [Halorhodospira halophila]|uniref:Uncharacterized protein n=1 Tax=Halorhodospira halophila (strain DSM 244 / SL1) TaxID=349124 RepID=A1WW72_HALHL|nr:hypothetical protein [Halorhodospira halophila]ABM61934.1 hypothetical protein Hhal_1158 [Halorhodospira halophila SL1]MBK1729738.1 hypothetical protein [Halorhodospira halophila]
MTMIPRSARAEIDQDGKTLRTSIELSELDEWMRAAYEAGVKQGAEEARSKRRIDPRREWPKTDPGRSVELLRQRAARETGLAPRAIDKLMANDDNEPAAILFD